jgi:hypothetical protein
MKVNHRLCTRQAIIKVEWAGGEATGDQVIPVWPTLELLSWAGHESRNGFSGSRPTSRAARNATRVQKLMGSKGCQVFQPGIGFASRIELLIEK